METTLRQKGIRMDRYPGTGERIRIDTWPENRLRLIFARYGEV